MLWDRVGHHSTSDDSSAYRSKDEVAGWMKKDSPINRFQRYLESKGYWSEEQDKEFRKTARRDILKAFSSAEARKKPAVKEMFLDVYDELPTHLAEQHAELNELMKKYPSHFESLRSAHAE
jgi:2-oxoisovalerate dehydrogenase E1 component alpha subunit